MRWLDGRQSVKDRPYINLSDATVLDSDPNGVELLVSIFIVPLIFERAAGRTVESPKTFCRVAHMQTPGSVDGRILRPDADHVVSRKEMNDKMRIDPCEQL